MKKLKDNKLIILLLIITSIICYLLLLSTNSIAQDASDEMCQIIGKVTDEEGNNVENVKVQIEGTSNEITTNSEGKYYLEGINNGEYTLKYTYSNYECVEISRKSIKYEKEVERNISVAIVYNANNGNSLLYASYLENIIKRGHGDDKTPVIKKIETGGEAKKEADIMNEIGVGYYGLIIVIGEENIQRDTIEHMDGRKIIVTSENEDWTSKVEEIISFKDGKASIEKDDNFKENSEDGYCTTKKINIQNKKEFNTVNVVLKKKEKEKEEFPGDSVIIVEGDVVCKDNSEGVGNVIVEIVNRGSDEVKYTTTTDDKGHYKFENVEGAAWDEINQVTIPREYTLKYRYGNLEQIKANTKYNGQDYEACDGETIEINTTTTQIKLKEEIIPGEEKKEEKATEELDIYMVIDCSGSMLLNNRIESAREGAKQFVETISNTYGDKARIGLVTYNIDAWQCLSLEPQNSTGKQNMLNRLDSDMSAENGTNTSKAINDTVNYFQNESGENRKKIMLIFTDGEPSFPIELNGKELTYDEYLNIYYSKNKELLSKINYNFGRTKAVEAYKTANAAGINMLTICCGNFSSNFVAEGEVYQVDDANIEEILSKYAVEYVKTISEGKEPTTVVVPETVEDVETSKEITSDAKDDTNRRNETIENMETIGYETGKKVIGLENNEGKDQETLEWLASNTQMLATADLTIEATSYCIYNKNLLLRERARNEIEIAKEISTIEIKLADESKLIYYDKENPNNNFGKLIELNKQKLITMDDELLHGATMTVKYKITVKNEYIVTSTYTLYDYIDEKLIFDPAQNPGWELVTETNKEAVDAGINTENNAVKTKIEDVPADSEKSCEITLTRLLATNCTDEYNNYVEIVKYSNELGRRIYGITPGNFKIEEVNIEPGKGNKEEKDTAEAELVSIIPPFGGNLVSKYNFNEMTKEEILKKGITGIVNILLDIFLNMMVYNRYVTIK